MCKACCQHSRLRKLSGWNCDMECADLLHTVWIGCAKDLVGSVLLDVVQYDPRLASAESWDAGLAALLSLFHSWCETRKLDKSLVEELSLVKLGVTNAVAFDFPKGMSKAYPNKVLVYFLADLLQATTVPELKRQAVACWALANWSYVIDMAEVFLTDVQARQAVESAKLYLQCHMLLARLALVAGRPRYKIRPRMHSYACEIVAKVDSGSRLNPKHTACFADESFVGKVCSVGLARPVHTSTLHLRLLQRMIMQLNAQVAS